VPTNIDSLHRANSLRIVCGMCDAHRSSSDYLPSNTGIRLRVGEANAVGSNVTLLSSVLPESRVRGCLDATHSVSRETVFGRRQQRRTALSVTCISWVTPLHIDPPAVKAEAFHVEPSNPDEAVQTEVYSGLDPSRFGEQALVSSQAEDNASAAFSERSRYPTDGSGASLPLYQGTNWFSPPAHHSPTSGSTTPESLAFQRNCRIVISGLLDGNTTMPAAT